MRLLACAVVAITLALGSAGPASAGEPLPAPGESLAPAAVYYGGSWVDCVTNSVAFVGGVVVTVASPPTSTLMWVAVSGLTGWGAHTVASSCGAYDVVANAIMRESGQTYFWQYKAPPNGGAVCRYLGVGVGC